MRNQSLYETLVALHEPDALPAQDLSASWAAPLGKIFTFVIPGPARDQRPGPNDGQSARARDAGIHGRRGGGIGLAEPPGVSASADELSERSS